MGLRNSNYASFFRFQSKMKKSKKHLTILTNFCSVLSKWQAMLLSGVSYLYLSAQTYYVGARANIKN